MKINSLLPPVWLLVLIVGLPILSETVYTPSLPDIAHTLKISESWVEWTLTIYLLGFSVGTLGWGILSDRFGRKICLILGMIFYTLGCIGCFYSSSIEFLMISRFIQAFGGSTGSVLGQTICRDAFKGAERGRVYSTIGGALSLAPALGPVIGGVIAQYLGWNYIFVALSLCGLLVLPFIFFNLPETHPSLGMPRSSSLSIFRQMIKDHRVLSFAIIIGSANGIYFSFFAEGSFCLIEILHLSPSLYGFSFISMSAAGVIGSYLSKKLQGHLSSLNILEKGIFTMAGGSLFMTLLIIGGLFYHAQEIFFINSIVISMFFIGMGMALLIPNALSLVLEHYQQNVGTASSFFGCFYYALISLFTFGMGAFHNGSLLPMPFYFLSLTFIMWIAFQKGIKNS